MTVLHESKPHNGRNQRSLWVLQLPSFVNLFILGFCYYFDKFPILSLGFLHSSSRGKKLSFPSYFISILGANINQSQIQ